MPFFNGLISLIIFLFKSLFHQTRSVIQNPEQIKSLTDSEKSFLWEEVVSSIITNNQPLVLKRHSLSYPLIISLTSYPPRFKKLHFTLKCLLHQSIKPDKILLWISYDDKKKITSEILELCKIGIEIKYCRDIGPYKKIILSLEEYPKCCIVTADDDIYYWPTWLEELVSEWDGRKNDIVAHLVHKIILNNNQLPLEYHKWSLNNQETQSPSPLNFATGGAGVLYPPSTFHSDVLKADVFQNICRNADDIWLYWMSRLNGSLVRRTKTSRNFVTWPGTQEKTLYKKNIIHGNDNCIRLMIQKYGFPIAK